MTRESASQIGMNKTGIGLSPIDSKAMIEAAQATRALPDGHQLEQWRVQFAQETEPMVIGTVPPPSSVRGAIKTAAQMISGKRPSVFVDHLGARLAFERTGTRLYDVVLARVSSTGLDGMLRSSLERFREQELLHFQIIKRAMEGLGVDVTAQTPAADVAGVQSSGLLQVISDPRTSILQCLDALLTAELRDHESWTMLVGLAESLGHSSMESDFKRALAEEEVHLGTVRDWIKERMDADAKAS